MNKEIEMLYKTIEAKDKIINEQALEIARLNKKYENAVSDYEQEHYKIIKAKEEIEMWKPKLKILQQEKEYLLEILEDKENES